MDKYMDRTLAPEDRARDLLDRLTLREKIGLLNQRLYGFNIYTVICRDDGSKDVELTEEFKDEVSRYGGMGFLYGLLRADPWSGRDYSNGLYGEVGLLAYNKVQEYVVEHSRYGIPVTMTSECPHGHQALEGDVLPVNLAVGATFDPELYRKVCEINGRRVRSRGVHMALMSMLDILRDPRWGRSEECYGEDPVLASVMAAAATEGTSSAGVQVVAKHFCAQGECTGGINASAARIGDRELREIHFPAAMSAIEAGAEGIMAAYNEIDGVPCHANKALLTDMLREELGFEGIVMSDGVAVDRIDEITRGDNVLSGAIALTSGVDVGLWDTAFGRLEEAVCRGLVSESDINRAAGRVLTGKFKSGLFDSPYISIDGGAAAAPAKDTQQAEEEHIMTLTQETFVLVRNRNVLPLKDEKLYVTGNNAEDFYALLGDYTPPVREERQITVRKAIERYCSKTPGRFVTDMSLCEDVGNTVCVAVIGGSSNRFDNKQEFDINGAVMQAASAGLGRTEMDCGEGVDISDISIPEYQLEYLKEAKRLGMRTVAVVVAGRPYAMGELEQYADALIISFYPGEKGAEALCKVLFGECSPGGRLPVSIPRASGQLPAYYNYRESYEAMKYKDALRGPLFCFGEGLGYGSIEYSDVSWETDRVSMVVTNSGSTRDRAVPQIYLHVLKGATVARVRELRAWSSMWLDPGESREVSIELPGDKLLIPGLDPKTKIMPEEYELILSDGSEIGRKELRAY